MGIENMRNDYTNTMIIALFSVLVLVGLGFVLSDIPSEDIIDEHSKCYDNYNNVIKDVECIKVIDGVNLYIKIIIFTIFFTILILMIVYSYRIDKEYNEIFDRRYV